MNTIYQEAGVLTPEARQKEGASGSPAVLADGQTWLLFDGGLRNTLDTIRDEIDDQARLRDAVDIGLIRNAAFALLKANYQLTDAEAGSLIIGAEVQPLTDAVSVAFFGDSEGRKTYTAWAAASLIANGVDPDDVPGDLRHHVLDILVQTGRTIPVNKFTDAGRSAPQYRAFRAKLAEAKARPEAAANLPAPPPEPTP